MNPEYCSCEVYSNKQVSDNIYEMTLHVDFKGQPGQFYMLRSWDVEPFLSRPIRISNIKENTLTFLYEVKGKGTKLFSNLKSGDLLKLTGPIGTGFPLEENGRIGIVAGGIGLAPMIYLCNRLDNDVDFYGGFRERSFYTDEIKKCVKNLYISTDSGLEGHNGLITEIFEPEKYSVVYTCGPVPMMKRVVEMCIEKNISVYISMERRMACGIGACLGCSIETVLGMKKVCKDGPVFKGEEVFFND